MYKVISCDFNNCLRKIRIDRGISQSKLAELTGLSQHTISAFELGVYRPSLYSAYLLSFALDCSIYDLFPIVATGKFSSIS